jgi:hypothetical protein
VDRDEASARPVLHFGDHLRQDGAVEHREQPPGVYRSPRAGWLLRYRLPLILLALCVALIAVTWTAWTPVLDAVATAAADLAGREGDGQTRVSATVGLAAFALLAFVLTWARATHPQRAVRLSGERGRMAVDAIAGGLRDALLELRDVREAEVSVQNRGRGRVLVRAWLRVSRDARIDDTLDDAAEWLIRARLGLQLVGPPLVDVRYDELDLRAARRGRDEDE